MPKPRYEYEGRHSGELWKFQPSGVLSRAMTSHNTRASTIPPSLKCGRSSRDENREQQPSPLATVPPRYTVLNINNFRGFTCQNHNMIMSHAKVECLRYFQPCGVLETRAVLAGIVVFPVFVIICVTQLSAATNPAKVMQPIHESMTKHWSETVKPSVQIAQCNWRELWQKHLCRRCGGSTGN